MSNNDYNLAWDSLCRTIGAAEGRPNSGYFAEQDHLSIDQRIEVAKVAALLSISQELSKIHHAGINEVYDPTC